MSFTMAVMALVTWGMKRGTSIKSVMLTIVKLTIAIVSLMTAIASLATCTTRDVNKSASVTMAGKDETSRSTRLILRSTKPAIRGTRLVIANV